MSIKEALKGIAFRLKNWQFAVVVLAGVLALAAGIFSLARLIPLGVLKYFILIIFIVVYSYSRISLLNQVGIGFMHIILFGALFVFGFWWGLIIIAASTVICVNVINRPTPIDMIINKSMSSIIMQVFYNAFWMTTMLSIFHFGGQAWVLDNLFRVFTFGAALWVGIFIIFSQIFTVQPFVTDVIKATMLFGFNMLLNYAVVPAYIRFLMGLA